jgi:hypothetical protein
VVRDRSILQYTRLVRWLFIDAFGLTIVVTSKRGFQIVVETKLRQFIFTFFAYSKKLNIFKGRFIKSEGVDGCTDVF